MLWLKDSPSEKRVIKHLERAIKDKLFKAGLDTGGRQIEVKFITTSIPSEVFGGKEDGGEGVTDESMTSEEARQFQGMIYNLMVSFIIWLIPKWLPWLWIFSLFLG